MWLSIPQYDKLLPIVPVALSQVSRRVLGIAAAAALLVVGAGQSHATDKIWTGEASTNWFEPNNWNPPGVPESADTAYLTNKGSVYLQSDVMIHGLYLNNYPFGPGVDGPGNLTITNFHWRAGLLKGTGILTIPAEGLLRIEMANLQRRLVSFGTVRHSGDLLLMATLENLGSFEISGRWTAIRRDGLNGFFRNAATFIKSAEMFTNSIAVPFENTGQMNLLGGGLHLLEFHTNRGNLEISETANLELRKPGFIAASCFLEGTGQLRFLGSTGTLASMVLTTNRIGPRIDIVTVGSPPGDFWPTVNFGSSVALRECSLDGVMTGNGTLTITNFTWTSGNVTGTGGLIIPSNGVCNIVGSYSVKRLDRPIVLNYGDIVWSGATDIVPSTFPPQTSSTLINRGIFRASAYGSWLRPIVNEGLFIRSGSPAWRINLVTNSGVIEVESGLDASYVQIAGETYLKGTNASLSGNSAFLGGVLRGNGRVWGGGSPCTPALATDGGEISPGDPIGILTVEGTLSAYSRGKIMIEIAGTRPGIDFDQIKIRKGVTVQGLLRIVLTNGFVPQLGDRFEIMTYTNAIGCSNAVQNFFRISGTDVGGGVVLLPEYSATNLVLVATNAPPADFYVIRNPADRTRHHIRFHSTSSANYVLQASTTLRSWSDLVHSDEAVDFIDYINLQPDAWRYPYRFFRILIAE